MSSDASAISPETLSLYRAAEYRVFAEPAFTMRVDEPSGELARLHAARGVRSSAYVTAFNPRGVEPADKSNAARQAELEATLRRGGLAHVPGEGGNLAGTWREPSFLVLGVTLEGARSLGEAYEQNAILFASADAVPRLVLLR
jgi:hypothetical protein